MLQNDCKSYIPALFFTMTIPVLLTLNTLWMICFAFTCLGSNTPSIVFRPSTLCKLKQNVVFNSCKRKSNDTHTHTHSVTYKRKSIDGVWWIASYVLCDCHFLPDLVDLLGGDVTPAYDFALVHLANGYAVSLVPRLWVLRKIQNIEIYDTNGTLKYCLLVPLGPQIRKIYAHIT